MENLFTKAFDLLKDLISTESFSREEQGTLEVLSKFFNLEGVAYDQLKNNIWAKNKYYDSSKPTILLNSHHDTVKPNNGYTNDPFSPIIREGKLYGLGSNDAGGCLVSLISTFLHYYDHKGLKYNLIIAATAEEEISGPDGIALLKPDLGELAFAIVGEPTLMDVAVSEKGLVVIDAVAKGKAGHAARNEGVNAIYKAVEDISWIESYKFPKVSPTLGEMKMTVSSIGGGKQHNVVPDECTYVIDVRVTDAYSNKEVVEIIDKHTLAEIKPRSLRLNSSSISMDHDFVKACIVDGAKTYGSPTLSDQALLNIPSIKMGPGDSARSHTPDEFIYIDEIRDGIVKYIRRLGSIL